MTNIILIKISLNNKNRRNRCRTLRQPSRKISLSMSELPQKTANSVPTYRKIHKILSTNSKLPKKASITSATISNNRPITNPHPSNPITNKCMPTTRTSQNSAKWWTTMNSQNNSRKCRPHDAALWRWTNKNSGMSIRTTYTRITGGIISVGSSLRRSSWTNRSMRARSRTICYGSSSWRDWTALGRGQWRWVSCLSNIRISFDITILT